MDENDHRLVTAEPDALKQQQVGCTIQKFAAAGFAAVLKDDYVALYASEHRIMETRFALACAIET